MWCGGAQDLSFRRRAAEQRTLLLCLQHCGLAYPTGAWTCLLVPLPGSESHSQARAAWQCFWDSLPAPILPQHSQINKRRSPRLVTRTGARTSVSGTVSGDALEEGMAGLHNSSLQEAGCTLSTGYGLPVDLFKPFPHLFLFH